jgi:malate permease and related proteins
LIAVVAAIALSVAAGLLAGPRAQGLARGLLDAIFWVLLPFITFFSLARLELTTGIGAGIVLGYLVLAFVGGLAWLIGGRVLRLPRPSLGALVVVVVLANTGYLGLPLTAALLGTDDLGAGIAFDTLVSGPMFYVTGLAPGTAFGDRAGDTGRERARTFLLRNPPLVAAVAGLAAPASLAPDVLVDAAQVVVFALLPIGFFVLGVFLAAEGPLRARLTAPVGVAIGLRLVVAPALLAGLSAIIVTVPDAYLLLAAMPSAINSLTIAHVYGLDLRLTTSALAWTTGLAVAVAIGAGAL